MLTYLQSLSPLYMFLIWVVIAIIFVVAEVATFGFVLIFFGFGALIAGLCAWIFGVGLLWQLVIFIAASLVSLIFLRKIGIKTFRGQENKEVVDDYHASIIGRTAVVTEEIIPPAAGQVKYSGSFWPAVADAPIKAGQTVEITERTDQDSLTLKVKAL